MRTFRLYFNRKSEAPQVWSIDEGTQESEVNVKDFILCPGCRARGHYDAVPVNRDTPSAWMWIYAAGYQIENGVAEFYA